MSTINYLLTEEKTERLNFRPLVKEDFEDWLPLFEKKEAGLFLGLDTSLSAVELCEKWFEKAFWRYENNEGGMNVLIDRKTNKMIGQSGLLTQNINGVNYLEVGYSILPEYWGKGFATEVALKCKEFAFENNLNNELVSMIHKDNIASQKVALNNGMKLFKQLDSYKGIPVKIYKIDKSSYEISSI